MVQQHGRPSEIGGDKDQLVAARDCIRDEFSKVGQRRCLAAIRRHAAGVVGQHEKLRVPNCLAEVIGSRARGHAGGAATLTRGAQQLGKFLGPPRQDLDLFGLRQAYRRDASGSQPFFKVQVRPAVLIVGCTRFFSGRSAHSACQRLNC